MSRTTRKPLAYIRHSDVSYENRKLRLYYDTDIIVRKIRKSKKQYNRELRSSNNCCVNHYDYVEQPVDFDEIMNKAHQERSRMIRDGYSSQTKFRKRYKYLAKKEERKEWKKMKNVIMKGVIDTESFFPHRKIGKKHYWDVF